MFVPTLAAQLARARHNDLIQQAEQARLVRTARDARRAQRSPRVGRWAKLARLLHLSRRRAVLPTTALPAAPLPLVGGRGSSCSLDRERHARRRAELCAGGPDVAEADGSVEAESMRVGGHL
jgi:hypothetical protein